MRRRCRPGLQGHRDPSVFPRRLLRQSPRPWRRRRQVVPYRRRPRCPVVSPQGFLPGGPSSRPRILRLRSGGRPQPRVRDRPRIPLLLSRSSDALLPCGPGAAFWELELVQGLGLHLGGVAGGLWRDVAAALDLHWIDKMLVEVIHVLKDPVLERGADTDVVEDGEMLDVLAQSHTAGVRTDGHAEFCRHQEHGDDLVDAAEAAGVYLAERDGISLQELLEKDAVLAMLARGDADR